MAQQRLKDVVPESGCVEIVSIKGKKFVISKQYFPKDQITVFLSYSETDGNNIYIEHDNARDLGTSYWVLSGEETITVIEGKKVIFTLHEVLNVPRGEGSSEGIINK